MCRLSELHAVIARAAGIYSTTDNPEYTSDNFLMAYPQFSMLDISIVDAWVGIAHQCVKYSLWDKTWELGMGLFIAHFLTLYQQTIEEDLGNPVLSKGLSKGLITSESVGGMSVSYDLGSFTSEFDGWGTFKQTIFGQQYAHFLQMMGGFFVLVW